MTASLVASSWTPVSAFAGGETAVGAGYPTQEDVIDAR
jgi:hypothetical protein